MSQSQGLCLLMAVLLWALGGAPARAQKGALSGEGQQIFQRICSACHTIGGGRKVGPDLQGVLQRRSLDWLKTHIQSPSAQYRENDPICLDNRKQYGMQMPDLGLTSGQTEAVLAYLAAGSGPPAGPDYYLPTLGLGGLAIAAFTLIGLRAGRKSTEATP
ncbi:MAG TPA: cytochrome c [Candidatus Nitrosotenuis sp.]|nr:cytochrome c [Candidatus Nitrosotenuis sp.]